MYWIFCKNGFDKGGGRMQKYSLSNYQVEIDKNATGNWYKKYDGWEYEYQTNKDIRKNRV